MRYDDKKTAIAGCLLMALATMPGSTATIIPGCDEAAGSGQGYIKIQGSSDASALGSWVAGCGDHNDSAEGSWHSDSSAGTWTLVENGKTGGVPQTDCSITNAGHDDIYKVGMLNANLGAARGNCNGSNTEPNPDAYVFKFDMHDPAVALLTCLISTQDDPCV